MTIDLIKFKCPACGNQVGEKEYVTICNEFNKKIQETVEDQESKHEEEIYILKERHRKELENKVSQLVQLQVIEHEKKSSYDQAKIIEKYENEIQKKDEEIKEAELQKSIIIDKSIEKALEDKEEDYRQKVKEFQLQILRIQNNKVDS